jgi:hypothetical protein
MCILSELRIPITLEAHVIALIAEEEEEEAGGG